MNIHRSARTTFASRVLLVQRVRKEGWSIEEAASAFGISDTTVRKWLGRFDDVGVDGLRDRTSKPHRQPLKTAPSWEAQILELRAVRMTVQRIAHSLKLAKSTVARVLGRYGKSRLPPLHPAPPVMRYEWKHPGELIHLDVKNGVDPVWWTPIESGVQPTRATGEASMCIDFATFAEYVGRFSDPFSVAFRQYLDDWRELAGARRPLQTAP